MKIRIVGFVVSVIIFVAVLGQLSENYHPAVPTSITNSSVK